MRSVRQELIDKGVTNEAALRYHLNFILETERQLGRKLDLSRYQPNPDALNFRVPAMMG